MRRALFAFLALILIGAIALIVYGGTRPRVQTFHGRLADLLPEAPQGWTRTMHPIADTPEMQAAVGELLNFDDGVFVDYTKQQQRLSVYIAYWKPGKMTHRDIARHTPDVCWVGAGWRCEARQTLDGADVAGGRLMPVEARTFTAHRTSEFVWFWHVVGGRPKSYGTGGRPPWYAAITDAFTMGLGQREEQFFVRLSSPAPLEDPTLAPILGVVLENLPLRPGPSS